MRTLIGPAPAVLARRWLALERLASVTLRRDAYAEPPGPTVGLALGERTAYRAAAWLLDAFERETLGDAYPAWGGSAGLACAGGRVEPVSVGGPGMVTHTRTLPRDAWAAVGLAALAGDAAVGVLTRAAGDAADGYRITATPSATRVERLDAGVATVLASEPTPWRPGEMLRVVWHWDRCRVYRDAIVVVDVRDAARLTEGRAGLVATRGDAGAEAAIASFVGGAARHEYLGAGLDLGDVQLVIGQPASFDLTLSNLAPMGGKARFAALLRHGLNVGGTYDLDRGLVRVLTVVDGCPAPLTAGVGLIDAPAEVAEDRVRLVVRGRDAFLTPKITPGRVVYLAGPPPGGLLPMPTDPCEPSVPPVIDPGAVPPEPEDPPGDEGIGPEAPGGGDDDDESGGGGGALAGLFVVDLGWDGRDESDQPIPISAVVQPYTAAFDAGADGPLAAPPAPAAPPAAPAPLDLGGRTALWRHLRGGSGSETSPDTHLVRIIYRGADIGGTHLSVVEAEAGPPDSAVPVVRRYMNPPGPFTGYADWPPVTFTVARYSGSGIATIADLAALTIETLAERRIATIAEVAVYSETVGGVGDGGYFERTIATALDAFFLEDLTGPQIIAIEFPATGWMWHSRGNIHHGVTVSSLTGGMMVIRAA